MRMSYAREAPLPAATTCIPTAIDLGRCHVAEGSSQPSTRSNASAAASVHASRSGPPLSENPTRALYYPHIEFRSLDWLKSALLYWEGVKRIVPDEEYTPNDCDELRPLLEAGLVENVSAVPFAQRI